MAISADENSLQSRFSSTLIEVLPPDRFDQGDSLFERQRCDVAPVDLRGLSKAFGDAEHRFHHPAS